MTEIQLMYNPFKSSTVMKINNELIADTNFFSKYIKTPMQNWVEIFTPKLFENCNDDEIVITFQGLQINFEPLNKQTQLYREKHKDVQLNLKYEESRNLIIRMQELSNIIYRIYNNPNYDCKEKVESILERYKSILEVVVVSSDENLMLQVISNINEQMEIKSNEVFDTIKNDYKKIDDSKKTYTTDGISYIEMLDISMVDSEQSRFITTCKIDNKSARNHFNTYKKSLMDIENSMILIILNGNIDLNKKNFLDVIARQYKEKDKRNKERVIFVADSLFSASEYLKNEFIIETPRIFAPEEMLLIKNKILKYIDEYFLVQKIVNTKNEIDNLLKFEKRKFDDFLNLIDEDDGKQKRIDFINLDSIKNKIDLFIQDLTQSYGREIQYKYMDSFAIFRFNEKISTKDAIDNSKTFIEKKLEIAIEDFINNISGELYNEYKINVESIFSLISDCPGVKILQNIMEKAIPLKNMYLDALPIDEILAVIKNNIRNLEIIHKTPGKKNIPLMVFMTEKGEMHEERKEKDAIKYEFYDGMCKLTELELLCNDEFIQPSQIASCVNVFENNIIIIKPVLSNVLGKVKEYFETYYQDYKESFKKNIISKIKEDINSEISYIDGLFEKLSDTTEL